MRLTAVSLHPSFNVHAPQLSERSQNCWSLPRSKRCHTCKVAKRTRRTHESLQRKWVSAHSAQQNCSCWLPWHEQMKPEQPRSRGRQRKEKKNYVGSVTLNTPFMNGTLSIDSAVCLRGEGPAQGTQQWSEIGGRSPEAQAYQEYYQVNYLGLHYLGLLPGALPRPTPP